MLLGITSYCYHWCFNAPFPRERREYYGLVESYPPPSMEHWNLKRFLDRAVELGLDGVEVDAISHMPEKDPAGLVYSYKDKFKYINWSECRSYVLDGDSALMAIDASIHNLELANNAGADVMRMAVGGNRFWKSPTVEEQLTLIKRNMEPVVRRAEELGIVIALENHADYTSDEILEVINHFDSKNLRVNLDIGNPLPVGEDMYQATEKLAPYAVTVHFKDWKVTPLSFFGAKIVGTALGEGIIDLKRMLEILHKSSPDPKHLRITIEIMLEHGDEDLAASRSVATARQLLSDLEGAK